MEQLTTEKVLHALHGSIPEEDRLRFATDIVYWFNHRMGCDEEHRNLLARNLWLLDLFTLGLFAHKNEVMQIRKLSMRLPG